MLNPVELVQGQRRPEMGNSNGPVNSWWNGSDSPLVKKKTVNGELLLDVLIQTGDGVKFWI